MLRISPKDVLTFSDKNDTVLNVANETNSAVVYKIQTTSPDKFRVRPRCGVLQPGESLDSSILIKATCTLQQDFSKDKFRVISLQITPCEAKGDTAALYKNLTVDNPNIKEHRLRSAPACAAEPTECMLNKQKSMESPCMGNAINDGNDTEGSQDSGEHHGKRNKPQRKTEKLQYFTITLIVFLSMAFAFMFWKQSQFNDKIQTQIEEALKNSMASNTDEQN
ncbi:motile sperm domain-containing protein 2-like [Teleopsis dalmanni]|uniref:motile sperm domain-containing protein 2-like n=1 Tax=Teleopsis dalmanni TaxID=139649 RepID=UPI0018CCB8E4|nr:motile sperm domain-containing protein 2-like [Teleopsis dalmanni]XP_037938894.1 motile sperm domain-containing protein 2-like [Teleopsis dalmanni]